MKRFMACGALCATLIISLIVFPGCSTSQAEYCEQLQPEEYAEYISATINYVGLLSAAVGDMRETRIAATALGAFENGGVTVVALGPAARPNPLDLGDAPTRTQFTLMLNSVTVDSEQVQEVNTLRPGLDVTVYNHANFYYIEGGLRIMGIPFSLVNIGIDGSEVSARIPLLYDRYFAVDLEALFEEQAWLMSLGQMYSAQMEMQKAMIEAFTSAVDFEALLMDMVDDLLEAAVVEAHNGVYNVVIPASDATAALSVVWDAIFEVYAMLDVSAFNGEFEDEWAEILAEGREFFDEVRFTQDVIVSYEIDNDVLMSIEVEGFLGDELGYEARILVAYANNSGDHVGDVLWIFEVETLNENVRVEYFSTLDTTNGYVRSDSFVIYHEDRWGVNEAEINWNVNRTVDNTFDAGLEISINDFDINFFAQGGMAFGEGYFSFDLDRLGIDVGYASFSVDLELSAFLNRETIEAAALPVINAVDQFFVMDAPQEELDRVRQQVEDNMESVRNMFSLFNIGR